MQTGRARIAHRVARARRLARSYARSARPAPDQAFDAALLLQPVGKQPQQSTEQLQRLQAQLQERDAQLQALAADRDGMAEQLARALVMAR